MALNSGSIDSNVIYDQSFHRSSIVWDKLGCIRKEAVVQRNIPLYHNILSLLQASRFYGVARLGFIQLDWHLITALDRDGDRRRIRFICPLESALSPCRT